jgi:mannitol/fructose-specific phosphotransferase system IIA component
VLYLAANTAERLDLLQDMVSGYARGGHMTPANRVLALAADGAERLALLQDMAACYALGGHVTQANRVLGLAADDAERLAMLQHMATNYARGGDVTQASSVLALVTNDNERHALLKRIAQVLKEKGVFFSSDSALFMLAVFKPSYQQELATELNELKGEMKVDVTSLVSKATQLHPLLTTPSSLTHPHNFRYRLGKKEL